MLRRHVVERCIYAVDLDPLAVELCRLSLWIETMDRTLPFGFLDHKIKCGNSLIGAWFDQFRHYPVIEVALLPSTFAEPSEETRDVARQIESEMRFFHWELEFPDVYREPGSGFDAILGNPP